MDPDETPELAKAKVPRTRLAAPVTKLGAAFKQLPAVFTRLLAPLKNVLAALTKLLTTITALFGPFKKLAGALSNVLISITKVPATLKKFTIPKKRPTTAAKPPVPKKHPTTPATPPGPKKLPIALPAIPKKFAIPAIAGAVVLVAGAGAFAFLHARGSHATGPQVKAAAVATITATAAPSASCSGVVRDIYRQTVDEDPSVTLDEVRSEVKSSGVSCAPVPEIAAQLKSLSPACRDMVQYTYLEVRDGHPDITVNDIRDKVVKKSVACDHDRSSTVASVPERKTK